MEVCLVAEAGWCLQRWGRGLIEYDVRRQTRVEKHFWEVKKALVVSNGCCSSLWYAFVIKGFSNGLLLFDRPAGFILFVMSLPLHALLLFTVRWTLWTLLFKLIKSLAFNYSIGFESFKKQFSNQHCCCYIWQQLCKQGYKYINQIHSDNTLSQQWSKEFSEQQDHFSVNALNLFSCKHTRLCVFKPRCCEGEICLEKSRDGLFKRSLRLLLQLNVFIAFAKDLFLVIVYLQPPYNRHESSIIIIIGKNTHSSWLKYMYKFYAVQRWSSYAYWAVTLKVGGYYLMLFTNCSLLDYYFFGECCVKTPLL